MKYSLGILLAGLSVAALAQNTPRGVKKQIRADRHMQLAHTPRRGESLSEKPHLLRKEDKLAHRKRR